MSDSESSGAVTPAAETGSTPSAPPATHPDQPPSTFGNNRGSGLARGKRPTSPAPQAASAAPATDYKPTAVSIVTAPTEYKNPFAPPAPPAQVAAEVKAPAPAAAEAAPAPVAATPPPAADTVVPPAAASEPEPEAKAELKILPPEAPKRVEHNWESQSFRSAAAQGREEQARGAGVPDADRRPRRDDRRDDRRGDRPEVAPPPRTEAPKKSGGFFGWLKGLFAGPAPTAGATPSEGRGEREYGRDGGYRRRRHRGGRGRRFQGDPRGPREGGPREGGQREGPSGQFSGEPRSQGGEGGDFRQHGRHRRRRRGGGGGGYRGEGGGFRGDSGYRNNPRPDSGPPPSGS